MKKLDFKPAKSKLAFRNNYKLHDLAEKTGKNLLIQWGIDFKDFGEDRRYEKLWEKGEDKPDIIIYYKEKTAFLDWKGKHTKGWIVNSRAIKSYIRWNEKSKLPVIIAFLVFDDMNNLTERRFAFLPIHRFIECEEKQWDKNKTVKFIDELPLFTKDNIKTYLIQKLY